MISVVDVNTVFVVGSGVAPMENAGIGPVKAASRQSVLGSGTAFVVTSTKTPGVCSATASAVRMVVPSIICSAGTSGVGSVLGLVEESAGLSVGCSPKGSVISSGANGST